MLDQHFSCMMILDFQEDMIVQAASGAQEDGIQNYFRRVMALNKMANECGLRVFATHFVDPAPQFRSKLNLSLSNSNRLISKVMDERNVVQKNNLQVPESLLARVGTLQFQAEKPVLVVGLETDGAVLSACYQLWERNIDFKVSQAHVTGGNRDAHVGALHVMEKNFRCLISDASKLPGKKTEVAKTDRDDIDSLLGTLWDYVARISLRVTRALFR